MVALLDTDALRPADSERAALVRRKLDIRSKWPHHDEDEIAAVVEVLKSGRVNSLVHGDKCRAFEVAFAKLSDMPHAISLGNGTLALELALRAQGIGPGDEVIVTPRSFMASAACVVTCGATPVFADVERDTQNISARTVERVLTDRTRAILPVHLAGMPCAIDELAELARRHDLKLIEDCAQAHGASYKGRPLGSFGDAAAFSFCTDKIMSTGGEGGMLLLRDTGVWRRAWSYKDHGKDPELVASPNPGGGFRWVHSSVGSNYRMTEMQAAIGLCQLAKLDQWVAARRARAAILDATLGGLAALRLLPPEPGHAYYKYYAFVRPERLGAGWSRDRILREANACGIPCGTGVCPEIYREKAFRDLGIAPAATLPVARELGETSLMLPVDPTLSTDAVSAMGEVLADIVHAAAKGDQR